MDLKTFRYTAIVTIPEGLLPGKVTELRRERFTVMTERGEATAALKGAFYHGSLPRERWEHHVAQKHENKYVPR